MRQAKLLAALLLLVAGTAHAQLFGGGVDEQDLRTVQLLENGGCENGESRWTETGSSVLDTVTSGANLGVGAASCSWDASAATEVVDSSQVDVPVGLGAKQCVAHWSWKGGDANITAQVVDGTAAVLGSQVLSAATDWTPGTIVFSCPTSGTIGLRLLAGADAAIIYYDQAFVGFSLQPTNANPVVFQQTDTVTNFGGTTGTITHNKGVAIENQDWIAVVTTGAASLQLDPSVFITDKTTSSMDYDFSGLSGTDTVTVKLKDTGFTAYQVATVQYDSGVLSASPSFPVSHGLPGRPAWVTVLTEGQTTAGDWDVRFDLCSFDDTSIDCDLSGLTIDGTHRVQIQSSMVAGSSAAACADASTNGFLCNGDQSVTGEKTLEGVKVTDSLTLQKETVTIAGGSITPTSSFHAVDTEASAATDDLDTIAAGTSGQILVLRSFSNARDVTVRSEVGNINLAFGSDTTFEMDNVKVYLTLMYDATSSKWMEISRSHGNWGEVADPTGEVCGANCDACNVTFYKMARTGNIVQVNFSVQMDATATGTTTECTWDPEYLPVTGNLAWSASTDAHGVCTVATTTSGDDTTALFVSQSDETMLIRLNNPNSSASRNYRCTGYLEP